MISKVGMLTISGLEELGNMAGLVQGTFSEIFEQVAKGRFPFRMDHVLLQGYRAGVGSVPMVILLSLFVGLTMALLTGYQLRVFGMVTLVPAVVSVSFTREMGPLFTGIVLASRIGAAYTAELGAMAAGGEVQAIESLGIGARRFLVAPRFLAIFLLTPCLAIISILSGIFGAALISELLLDISYGFFFDQVMSNLLIRDVISGIAKSLLFGAIIGSIACYKGLAVKGGAVGVGTATTSSVVTAISTVIVVDSIFNVFILTFFP